MQVGSSNSICFRRSTLHRLVVMGLAAPLGMIVFTPAAAAQRPALEEVVVTAERRESRLQESPISIAVMGESQLEAVGAFEVDQIADYMPNIRINKTTGSQSNVGVVIRGVGAVEGALAVDPAIGLYADGVYLGRAAGAAFDVVDLERIEVLRGPQGTLYGRNSTGGAINLISKKPTGEFGFSQFLSYGERGHLRSSTTIDTPRIGDVAAKLSFNRTEHDGDRGSLYKNTDLGGLKSNAARMALRWTPTDHFTADYVWNWSQRRENNSTTQISHVRPLHIGVGGSFYQQLADVSSSKRMGSLPLDNSRRSQGTSDINAHALTLEWELDNLTLKSITSYREWHGREKGNSFGQVIAEANTVLDGTSGAFIPAGEMVSAFSVARHSEQKQVTQEFQILGTAFNDRLDFTGGVYFFTEEGEEDNPQQFVMPAAFAFGQQSQAMQEFLCQGTGPAACMGKSVRLDPTTLFYTTDNQAFAIYGQGTYAFTDALSLTLGARWSMDWKETSLTANFSDLGLTTLKSSKSWSKFNPMATLSWQVSDAVNTYFKISTGYRSGGYNVRSTTSNAFMDPVDEENITSYEFGIKSEFWDRRARLNAAVFYMDYSDQQITQFEAGSGGASTVLVNAGESTSAGVEIDFTVTPLQGLMLQLSYGYLDIDYDEFITGIVDPVTGMGTGVTGDIASFAATNLHAPEHTAALVAEYTFPQTRIGTVVAQLDITYADERAFHNQMNLFDSVDAYELVNGRITLQDIPVQRGNLQLALWGRNLTNEAVREFGIDFGALGYSTNTYRELRSFGIDARYEF